MNHTPGPWIVNTWTTGRRTIETMNGLVICEVHNTHDGNEANARFVVQACNAHEELLEALKTLCAPTIVRPVGFGERYERAEAAIAKATGG